MRWRVLHLALVWGVAMTMVQADAPAAAELDALETGDAGRYTATYVGDWPFDEGVATESLAFTIGTPQDSVRADGTLAPAWPMSVQEIRLDMDSTGHLVPSGDVYVRLVDGTAFAEQRDTTRYDPVAHCVLDAVRISAAPEPCRLPGIDATFPATPAQVGHMRVGGLVTRHIDMGDLSINVVPDIPVPVRVEASTERGTVRYDLAGYQPGHGSLIASSIAPPSIQTAPVTPWLIEDTDTDFPISGAFETALRAPDWPHLRTWLRGHPDAIVVQAAFDGAWHLQLADTQGTFAFQISQEHGLLGPSFDLHLLRPTIDPMAAPERIVTLASAERLFARHGGDMEAYGFSLVDGVQLVVAEGPVAWSKDGRHVLADDYLTIDGSGHAIERSGGGEAHLVAPMGFASQGWPVTASEQGWVMWLAAASAVYLAGPKLAMGLFSRLAPNQLTQDVTRAAIMDAVREEPGLHLRALADRIDAPVGRVRHHARKLVQGGLLRERITPGFTCYFADSTDRAVLDAGPITRSAGARRVLASADGRVAKEIAAAAGLSPATASYHLKRLREAGLVSARAEGRTTRFQVTAAGAAARRGMGL